MKLETNRLFIRRLSASDWPAMKNIFIDFNRSKYVIYDMPLPTQDEDTKAVTRQFAESNLFFAVFLKESNSMMGYVCFHKDGNSYDLGYCFHSAYHANGYAYESITALIRYFADTYGATRFTAGTALDNTPSCKLLEKLGFVCASTEAVSFDPAFSFQGGNFVLDLSSI
ncbi:MAG: GNAT family N-acetyltransferase [Clostridia bacterium]|nr:GNAT family N-acetyltransferase [Clostridia bacterium]